MNIDKVIYSILKELEQGNIPNILDYGLELEQWGDIAEMILEKKYAKNIPVVRGGIGNPIVAVNYSPSTKITNEGREYLKANSPFAKAYKGVKELREWIKL